MRFLGPRSISSLLKAAIDVVYYGLYVFVVGALISAIALSVVPNLASEGANWLKISPSLTSGTQAIMLLAFATSLGGYLLIMYWTRAVFRTLAEGDVFHPANTQRLRWIGFALAGVEIFGYLTRALAEGIFNLHFEPVYGLRAVTTWFSVLVVFVLAEVFKEGARLRRESDLTV